MSGAKAEVWTKMQVDPPGVAPARSAPVPADHPAHPDAGAAPIPEGPNDRIGFQDRLGLNFTHRAPDAVWGEMRIEPFHLNRSGIVHGGVYGTILDAAMATVGSISHPEGRRQCVTLSMTIKFVGMAREGTVRLVARKQAKGRRIFTCIAEAYDDAGELLSHGIGTFQYAKAPPGGPAREGGQDGSTLRDQDK